jgi:hypothetical protein
VVYICTRGISGNLPFSDLKEKNVQSSSIWPWLRNQSLEDGVSPRKAEKTVSASADIYSGNTDLGGSVGTAGRE